MEGLRVLKSNGLGHCGCPRPWQSKQLAAVTKTEKCFWNPGPCQECRQTCSSTATLGLQTFPSSHPSQLSLASPLHASDTGLSAFFKEDNQSCYGMRGGRTLPCPGQLLGKRGQLQRWTHCWEERKEPAALAGFQKSLTGSSPASLLLQIPSSRSGRESRQE